MTLNTTNPNMPRWIVASLTTHFESTVNVSISPAPPFSVTGYDLKVGEDDQDHIEFRIQGPLLKDVPGWEVWEVPLNFLMTFRQNQVTDTYTLDRWLGVYQEAMRKPLSVFKHGNGVDDDGSLIGCLTPKTSKREFIRLDRYGFVKDSVSIQQATVGGTVDMWTLWE